MAPIAAPMTTVAPGAPLQAVDPEMSWATIVATVTAAMWPVLPRATPATSDQTVRRRSRSSSWAGRSRVVAETAAVTGG